MKRFGRSLLLIGCSLLGATTLVIQNFWFNHVTYWLGVSEHVPLSPYVGGLNRFHLILWTETVYYLGNWPALIGATLGYTSAFVWLHRHESSSEMYKMAIMVGICIATPVLLQNLYWLLQDTLLWKNWWSPLVGVVRCFVNAPLIWSMGLVWWGKQGADNQPFLKFFLSGSSSNSRFT